MKTNNEKPDTTFLSIRFLFQLVSSYAVKKEMLFIYLLTATACTSNEAKISPSGKESIHDRPVVKAEENAPFKLSLTEWESAMVLFHGNNHFIITDTSLTFYKTYQIAGADSLIFLDTLIRNSGLQKIIRQSKIEKWNDYYRDEHSTPVSGQHIGLEYESDTIRKSSGFHSYYFEPLKGIIDSLNVYLTDKNKIRYY